MVVYYILDMCGIKLAQKLNKVKFSIIKENSFHFYSTLIWQWKVLANLVKSQLFAKIFPAKILEASHVMWT